MRTRIKLNLPRLEQRTTWLACVLLAVALTVEILGRTGTTDLHDGLALSVLATLVVFGYVLWGKATLRWALPLRRAFDRLVLAPLRSRRFEIGIDLRRTPLVAPGTPDLLRDLIVGLLLAGTVLTVVSLLGGIDVRGIASRVLYIGYLAGLALLWAALLLCIATAILLPAACIHDAFACRHIGSGNRNRNIEYITWAAYFGTVLIAGQLLPVWVPMVLVVAALGAFVVTMSHRSAPSVTLLWRHAPRGAAGEPAKVRGEVFAMEWRTYETLCATLVALAFIDLILLALGGVALGLHDPDMEKMWVTTKLGSLAAWLGGIGLTAGAVFASVWVTGQRRRDPARAAPTAIHVDGHVEEYPRVARIFEKLGWQARRVPEPAQPDDVRIELLNSPMKPLRGVHRSWPLPVSLKGLAVPELQQLLHRRDEIQRRRALMRGLQKLFKHAARREYGRGQGFWLAPHYWFISGMTRDVDEEQADLDEGTVISGVVGPSYHRLLPHAARQHAHALLRALEIDLIFVEDGVGFRGLRRVLRVLFEHFDMHGGRLRLDERHCSGLPGLRLVLHEYELGSPLKKKGYPEPDYETLGRARILHVFKDRGEHEEMADVPHDIEDLPVPAPALGSA